MFCSYCGNKFDQDSKFCDQCGAPYEEKDSPSPAAQHFSTENNTPPTFNEKKQKKKGGCAKKGCLVFFIILAVLFVIIMLLPSDDESDGDYTPTVSTAGGVYGEDLGLTDLRSFYTEVKGDGTDVNTVMIYFIGSDLETEGGFASSDIDEMLDAEIGDNVNVVLMTGGAYEWENYNISNDTCQYWQVKDGELISINDDLGLLNMTSSDTLSGFVNDATSMFPADRYSLILWDHGGGTISGFGYDEHYPESMLTLADLETAFAQSNVKFDFVGFDACLMATAETALMLEPYADYLIASQELEPGSGWHYTNWLTELNNDPSKNTVEIAVNIIDDFVEVCEDQQYFPNATLSIVDLRQMPHVYSVLTDYFENSTQDIFNNEYRKISVARSDAKDFGDGGVDQIDMVDYINKAGVAGGENVISAISSAVAYYNNSSDVYDSYGLAMYFPHEYIGQYSGMQQVLHSVGYSPEYTRFFDVFISAMSGGQTQYSRSTGAQQTEDYSTEDWYDPDTASSYEQSTEGEFLGELVIDQKGDDFVLSLSDEEWEDINKLELQALLDDGEGYIDLGSDNVYTFDDDGDLLIEFDFTWVTLDGHTVPYYVEEQSYGDNDSWSTFGIVPAVLNDEEYIEIVVTWDDRNPEGYVSGYRKYSEVGTPLGKGLFSLEQGDKLEWLFDYYTYDWEFDASYIFGDVYTKGSSDIEVSYQDVGDLDAVVYFKLTDIYNNVYETEAVIYSDY